MWWMLRNSDGKKDSLLTVGMVTFILWCVWCVKKAIIQDDDFDWSTSLVLLPAFSGYVYKQHVKKSPQNAP